jgi:hypothetical protein
MFLLARYYFYTKFGVVKNAVRLARRFIGRVSWNASKSTTEIRLVPAWRSRVDDGGGLNAVDKLARINVGGAIWIQNNIDAIAVRQAVQEARVDSHAVVGRLRMIWPACIAYDERQIHKSIARLFVPGGVGLLSSALYIPGVHGDGLLEVRIHVRETRHGDGQGVEGR